MARKKPTARVEMVSFDVLYEDGTRSSNRRISSELLEGLDGDGPAKAILEAQDREIAERSGMPRAGIKSLSRSGAKKSKD